MKITAFIMLGLCLQSAATGISQKVSFTGTNVPLEDVITSLKQQTRWEFMYSGQELNKSKPVTISVNDVPVSEFLSLLFAGQPLTYQIRRKSVFIRDKKNENKNGPAFMGPSPPITIKGKVVNEKGEPVIASVIVKGTKKGTTTDGYGNFLLVDVDDKATLVISGINVESSEIKIEGRQELIVAAVTKVSEEETVVINKGYYSEKKKLSTASVAQVTAKQIEKQPVLNPLQALQGRMAGVYVAQNSGIPGTGFIVKIRGQNSLRVGANEPLYVVDGVPYTNTNISANTGDIIYAGTSPFNNIDPNSIESIEVLKDADGTSLYGSQGANGVVLITTKKGKAGRTGITANVSAGIGKVPRFIKLLNTQDYITMRKEGLANDGFTAGQYEYDYDLLRWDSAQYTNWQKVLLGGTARSTNADASISGGSVNTRFLLRGSFLKQTTVYPGDFAYQRGAGHFNLNHESVNRKFRLLFTADFAGDHNNLPGNSLVSEAIQLPPNAPRLYREDGELNWENSTWINPLAQLLRKYEAKTRSQFVNSTFSYEIISGLKLKANLGYNILQMKELSTQPLEARDPAIRYIGSVGGISHFGWSRAETSIIEPQIEFNKEIGIGELAVLTGVTARRSSQSIERLQGSGYQNDALIENLNFATLVKSITSSNKQYEYAAVYGRINYNVKENYIINLTIRRDGSSRFGPNRKFANFGAVGAAWIFSKESFFKDRIHFVSFGKLRSSYGIAGNDQIDDYQYLQLYSAIPSYQGVGTSIIPTQLANPDYSWEVNKKFEAAMELSFINDRIHLGINYYRNQSSNQLVGESIPGMTGFLNFQNNSRATVRNEGWEFEVSILNVRSGTFLWNTSFNLTIPKIKLVSYPGIQNSSYANKYEVGKSPLIIKRFHYTGVNPETGAYQYEDKDLDGNYFGNGDRQALVEVGQQYYGGLQNVIQYMGLELSFLVQFTKQTGQNYLTGFATPGMSGNQPAFVMNRWQQTNKNVSIQKFTTSAGTGAGAAFQNGVINYYPPSDLTISDASFIRLQNVFFAWHVPKKILMKAAITEASLYMQGQNLFTITNYFGFDPQSTSFSTLPPLRMITMGLKMSL